MGVAGSIGPPGGAPKPDPERVAALRYTLVDEPETCAVFGESARAALAALNDRVLAETRSGDLGECRLLLDHVRDRVAGLDPAELQPRGGLAGLFDSRGRRLKAFRAAYATAAAAVGRTAADIADRAGALARKEEALETLWTETRVGIADLNAHIAAARDWLAGKPPDPADAPVESVAPDQAPSPMPPLPLPHPLELRLDALESVRATAVGRLALIRAAQNADCRAPMALKQACDGVEAWRAEWRDALGLAGRRPRKIRPDPLRLSQAASSLADRLAAAARELSKAQTRRAELDARAAPSRGTAARAA